MKVRKKSERSIGIKFYSLLAVVVLAYLATILFFPSDSAAVVQYHISDFQLRLLSLAVVVPAIAIWITAFYSLVKIGSYAARIKDMADGKAFLIIYKGLAITIIGLPLSALVSRLLSYFTERTALSQAFTTIVNTHLTLAFYLFGFAFLAAGAWKLVRHVAKTSVPKMHTYGTAVALLVLSIVYFAVTLTNPSREIAVAPAPMAAYYMQDWLIITTIVIPYIITWGLGFYATLWLHTFHKSIGGKIYRKALKRLNTGFFMVILTTILVQFLQSASTHIYGWTLGAIIAFVYLLLFIIALGYILIAIGAKDLNRLEEIT